jgi:hypothetical protein
MRECLLLRKHQFKFLPCRNRISWIHEISWKMSWNFMKFHEISSTWVSWNFMKFGFDRVESAVVSMLKSLFISSETTTESIVCDSNSPPVGFEMHSTTAEYHRLVPWRERTLSAHPRSHTASPPPGSWGTSTGRAPWPLYATGVNTQHASKISFKIKIKALRSFRCVNTQHASKISFKIKIKALRSFRCVNTQHASKISFKIKNQSSVGILVFSCLPSS